MNGAGTWVSPCTGVAVPRGWGAVDPLRPRCPAVSHIISQDYCEAMQQLELEQDLRLHAEAFAHEVQAGPRPPWPWVLGGGEGTHGVGEQGRAAAGVPQW